MPLRPAGMVYLAYTGIWYISEPKYLSLDQALIGYRMGLDWAGSMIDR